MERTMALGSIFRWLPSDSPKRLRTSDCLDHQSFCGGKYYYSINHANEHGWRRIVNGIECCPLPTSKSTNSHEVFLNRTSAERQMPRANSLACKPNKRDGACSVFTQSAVVGKGNEAPKHPQSDHTMPRSTLGAAMKINTGLELLMGLLSVVLDTLFPAPGHSASTVFGRASSDLATDWQGLARSQTSPGFLRDQGCWCCNRVSKGSSGIVAAGHHSLHAADRRVASAGC
ncbi:hypothetical protein VFPPC_18734 [Pochonia chlamydosporia 170]|uniref:Uncharacterized protein n=1 Tax=Pochonia chlamydosporia 170 TaxID=1380566 RepID=A0A219ASG9_METCM|nr:hypothetical protein VFPPC_18734 [Pochonia chlamydosporia 170]OWT43539.1 hypothetical protein VFPPC_18734 [Pochonia chlamydosporia 170]